MLMIVLRGCVSVVNILPPGKLGMLVCCLLIFFQNLSGTPPECQIIWIQIRSHVLSGLIWVQSVCKSYQQTALGDRVKLH